MKRLILLLSVLLFGTAVSFSQITPPAAQAQVLACTTHTDILNTGSTTVNVVLACNVGTNAMGANGRLTIVAPMEACTAAGVPYAGCAGANTGTCNARMGLNTTAAGGNNILQTGATAAAVPQTMNIQLSNRNATNVQIATGFRTASSSISMFPGAIGSFDTTGATFFTISLQNSVSGDICGLRDVVVTFWPN